MPANPLAEGVIGADEIAEGATSEEASTRHAGSHQVAADEITLVRTREGLHELAEQVLAADLYRHTGRIGLRSAPGAIVTPNVIVDGIARQVRIEGTQFVVMAGEERIAVPITTVADVAALLDLTPGAPPVYEAATRSDPDRELDLDPGSVSLITEWYAFGDEALERFVAEHVADVFGPAQLWPEHFDLAVHARDDGRGEVVLGVSPGDAVDPEPYAYVAWQGFSDASEVVDPNWWNRPWGRHAPAGSFDTTDDLVAFYEEGWRQSR